MNERSRVLLLIPHYGGGGAEAVFALLARELSRDKYELHLGLITQAAIPAEAVRHEVVVHTLGAHRVRNAPFRLLLLIRRIKPQVILSGMFHLNFMILMLRPLLPRGTRILVRQNGTLSTSLAYGNTPIYTGLLYRLLYRRADKIICQSSAMADDLAGTLGLGRNRLAVLPNPVDVHAIRLAAAQSSSAGNVFTGPGPNLVAVGRLAPEKGFDLLLDAVHAVRRAFPSTVLAIAGSGPEETALKARCHRLGLDSAVHFAGHLEQPATLFSGASLFVLSSRQEGMPNALLEAAAAGLPLVATPASGGIVDLLHGQPGAWLTSEITAPALAASLLQALRVLRPAERFAHAFIEPFRMDCAVRSYEELIDAALYGEDKKSYG